MINEFRIVKRSRRRCTVPGLGRTSMKIETKTSSFTIIIIIIITVLSAFLVISFRFRGMFIESFTALARDNLGIKIFPGAECSRPREKLLLAANRRLHWTVTSTLNDFSGCAINHSAVSLPPPNPPRDYYCASPRTNPPDGYRQTRHRVRNCRYITSMIVIIIIPLLSNPVYGVHATSGNRTHVRRVVFGGWREPGNTRVYRLIITGDRGRGAK